MLDLAQVVRSRLHGIAELGFFEAQSHGALDQ
jgi:hypothetical protein